MKLIHSLWLSGALLLVGACPVSDNTGGTQEQLALPSFKPIKGEAYDAADKEVAKTIRLPDSSTNVTIRPSTMHDPYDVDHKLNPVQGIVVRFAKKDATMRPGLLLKCTIKCNALTDPVVKYFESTGALDAPAPDGTAKDGTAVYFSHDTENLAYVDVEAVTLNTSGHGRIKYTGRASWVITGRRPDR